MRPWPFIAHRLSFPDLEAGYQFERSLHARDLIVPVVGDVSGATAMRDVADDLSARRRESGYDVRRSHGAPARACLRKG